MMDAHVGQVIDELEDQALLDNTVIIFTSDHGDGHGAHRWNQKMSFYEDAVNIPFIVSWKGRTRAGVIDEETLISNTLDINSTLLAIAGVTQPDNWQGRNLMPRVLKDPGTETFTPRDFVVSEMLQADYQGRMLATNDFKYIVFDGGENPEVLIDLFNDPGELKPVTNDPNYRGTLNLARRLLQGWVAEIGDRFDVARVPAASGEPAEGADRTWGDRNEIESAPSCTAGTKGVVRLSMSGDAGDAFRIYLRCGDEVVAKCTARTTAGGTEASCQDGPNKVINGEMRCSTKPSLGNSPAATVSAAECE
jgi:hypothetical protein